LISDDAPDPTEASVVDAGRHITITDRSHGLPYSKGMMASSLAVSGLPIVEGFEIAERIERDLKAAGAYSISSSDLREMAAVMLSEVGGRYAATYMRWQAVEELNVPLIILLGGATGVGKSTIATQLAARLGITRVVSTDAIRQVLRSALSEELMPILHVSSFEADSMVDSSSDQIDPVIGGFKEQVQAVSVGTEGLITRALEEGTDLIVEGAHLTPDTVAGWGEKFPDAVLIPIVLTIESESLHRSHFHMRGLETKSRPDDKYLAAFGKIRKIQAYVSSMALELGVPVVEVFDLDSTLQDIISIVVSTALGAPSLQRAIESTMPGLLTRVKSWEILGYRKRLKAHG